ncbi:poly-gamma-glutamate biosynthesis protein PgsC [bacterium]|nr:poly-gamma-glutamate biosynthesis protein PgsC [bacterium]
MSVLIVAIGLGLFVSLIFAETFGLAAGGMVVPGYIAVYLGQPMRIIATLGIAFLTLLTIKFLSNYILIYGRRRFVLVILVAFVYVFLYRLFVMNVSVHGMLSIDPVGFIIPGLIALWMERQGVLDTLSSLFIASVIVRLTIIVLRGGELFDMALW